MASEKQIEKKACQWARDHGWYVRKFSSPSHRGVPDRIFIKAGRVVFIEFKKPAGRLTDLQVDEILQIQSQAIEARVVYSVEETQQILGTE